MSASALVLFDIDGTLIRNAGPHHKLALAEGIRRVTGHNTSLDNIDTAGMLDCDLITAMLDQADVSASTVASLMQDMMKESENAYHEHHPESLLDKLCPGVIQALRQLEARGAVLAVVTGNLEAIGWKKLQLAGVRCFFNSGAFAQSGRTRADLAKAAAQQALQEGTIHKQSRITLIGDHSNDIQAAKQNGFQSIAVATGVLDRINLEPADPDILIDDLTCLPIDRLF